jgi:hypothetical protein
LGAVDAEGPSDLRSACRADYVDMAIVHSRRCLFGSREAIFPHRSRCPSGLHFHLHQAKPPASRPQYFPAGCARLPRWSTSAKPSELRITRAPANASSFFWRFRAWCDETAFHCQLHRLDTIREEHKDGLIGLKRILVRTDPQGEVVLLSPCAAGRLNR